MTDHSSDWADGKHLCPHRTGIEKLWPIGQKLVHSLFLYDPQAKNGFYIFKLYICIFVYTYICTSILFDMEII